MPIIRTIIVSRGILGFKHFFIVRFENNYADWGVEYALGFSGEQDMRYNDSQDFIELSIAHVIYLSQNCKDAYLSIPLDI